MKRFGQISLRVGVARTLLALMSVLTVIGTAAPIHADSPPNPIQTENSLPGTTSWFVPTPRQDEIQGYFDDVTYLPGQNANLYVDSGQDPFSYTVYRMGYYQGLGGRQVASGSVASNRSQHAPAIWDDQYAKEKLLTTNWHVSTTIPLDSNWVSGYYLVKLHDDVNGGESYANFTLRSSTPAPIVINLSTNTWQAYNAWGGLSLYIDDRVSPPIKVEDNVAHMVSFLRPYLKEGGAGDFFRYDNPLVQWAESLGYPVSYSTDRDVRAAREAGPNTKLVIFSGHPEYYSMADRNELLRLSNNGVNQAFLGGNSWPWQARFDDVNHTMTVWRFANADPNPYQKLKTTRWALVGLPQDQLTGEMQTWGRQTGAQKAYATSSWPWDGAGVVSGQNLGPIEGHEWDGIVDNLQTPKNLLMLSRASFSGMPRVPADQAMVLWQPTPSSFIFNAGQLGFNWNLAYPGLITASWIGQDFFSTTYPASSQVKPAVERLVGNLIQRATGIPNPIPAIAPTATPGSFRILAPQPQQAIQAAPNPFNVSWSDPPAGVPVHVYLDDKLVGTVSAGNVFVGAGIKKYSRPPLVLTIKLVAGSESAQERVYVYGYNYPLFTYNQHKVNVQWDNDTDSNPAVCNPLSLTITALDPGAKPCW